MDRALRYSRREATAPGRTGRAGQGGGLSGPDQQVQDPHLGEPVTAPGEFLPDRSHRRPVAVQVAPVAADEPERALRERSLGAEVVLSQYVWTMLPGIGISAGRFGYRALVIFATPTPRMSANASKSCLTGSHGTKVTAADSKAPRGIGCRARSISRRRWRIAAIWAAEMRAAPRVASLRSGSRTTPAASGR
jgi:hypothetical protein